MVDVVDEEQYVEVFVMEVFGYCQVGQCDVQMVVWWFVYLVVYQCDFVENV